MYFFSGTGIKCFDCVTANSLSKSLFCFKFRSNIIINKYMSKVVLSCLTFENIFKIRIVILSNFVQKNGRNQNISHKHLTKRYFTKK